MQEMLTGKELGVMYKVFTKRRKKMMQTTGWYLIQERVLPINSNLDKQYRVAYEIIKVLKVEYRFFTTYEAQGYYDAGVQEYPGIVGEYATMHEAQKARDEFYSKVEMVANEQYKPFK